MCVDMYVRRAGPVCRPPPPGTASRGASRMWDCHHVVLAIAKLGVRVVAFGGRAVGQGRFA